MARVHRTTIDARRATMDVANERTGKEGKVTKPETKSSKRTLSFTPKTDTAACPFCFLFSIAILALPVLAVSSFASSCTFRSPSRLWPVRFSVRRYRDPSCLLSSSLDGRATDRSSEGKEENRASCSNPICDQRTERSLRKHTTRPELLSGAAHNNNNNNTNKTLAVAQWVEK